PHLSDCQRAIENCQRSTAAQSSCDPPAEARPRWKSRVVQQSQHQHQRCAAKMSDCRKEERTRPASGDSAQKIACAPGEDSAEAKTRRDELGGHGETRVA